MNQTVKNFSCAFIALIFFSGALNAQNWPQWRGTDGSGRSGQGNFPMKFSATENVVWRAELPGKGGSTPVVWKDRILITSGIGEGAEGEDGVLCYDWSGKLLWQTKLGRQTPGRHARGSGSNPTVATDGERIFTYFKSSTVAALDMSGKVLWKTNLRETYGEINYFFDPGSSPLLVGNNVVITVMHEGDSYLVAFDQKTGKVVWKADRNYPSGRETPQSYTTPLVVRDGGRTTIIVWGADHLTGHDGETGKMIWSYTGFNPEKRAAWRTIASPVIYQDIVVVPYGRGRFTAAMKTGVKGELSQKDWLWQVTDIGSDVATPVVHNGKVYILGFNGKVWCLDVQTGKEIWQTTLPQGKGVYYSSPALAEDKLYMINDEGDFYVGLITSDGLQIVNHTKFEDNFVATPVLIRNRILLRGTKYLYCIE